MTAHRPARTTVEVSGLPEELPDTVEVFMSINGGGGFDYVNQTVRMVRSATGTWTVDQVLRSGIA